MREKWDVFRRTGSKRQGLVAAQGTARRIGDPIKNKKREPVKKKPRKPEKETKKTKSGGKKNVRKNNKSV